MSSIEQLIQPLTENSKKWAELDYQTKLNYLLDIQNGMENCVEDWKDAGVEVRDQKSFPSIAYLFTSGASGVISHLVWNYQSLAQTGKPYPISKQRKTQSGQTAYTIFPNGLIETISAQGMVGEVFVSKEGQNTPKDYAPGVCGILAPGNFDSPVDILHKMFVENKVVAWKPHVVNLKSTLPFVKSAFKKLINDGYLVIIEDPSPKSGSEMIQSSAITEIIMTGGAATYDRIVWGSPEEQEENKKKGNKCFSKKFDAELGAVSPVIVVPGIWTDKELEEHATAIAVSKTANGGAICASPQVILVDQDWPQREKFIKLVKEKLNTVPRSKMYYPGAEDRQKKTEKQSENVEILGKETAAPVVFLNDLQNNSPFFKEECFALAIGEVNIKGENNPKTFVDLATDYANKKLFGTLSCSVLCPPSSETILGGSDYIVEKLNYGAIAYNIMGLQVFVYQGLPWGAYPGHTDTDIQSGQGKIHNPYFISHPVKSVLKAPFICDARLKVPKKDPTLEHQRAAYFLLNPGFFRLLVLIFATLFGI